MLFVSMKGKDVKEYIRTGFHTKVVSGGIDSYMSSMSSIRTTPSVRAPLNASDIYKAESGLSFAFDPDVTHTEGHGLFHSVLFISLLILSVTLSQTF